MIERNKSEIVNNECYECHKNNGRIFDLKCFNGVKCIRNQWQFGKLEDKQIFLNEIDKRKILQIIMSIYNLYKKYFISCPFIQDDGKIKLLDGDLILLKEIFDKYYQSLKITELQEENQNLKYASEQWFKIISYFQDNPEKINAKVGDDITDKLIEYFENKNSMQEKHDKAKKMYKQLREEELRNSIEKNKDNFYIVYKLQKELIEILDNKVYNLELKQNKIDDEVIEWLVNFKNEAEDYNDYEVQEAGKHATKLLKYFGIEYFIL
jgi:hypothetical protein